NLQISYKFAQPVALGLAENPTYLSAANPQFATDLLEYPLVEWRSLGVQAVNAEYNLRPQHLAGPRRLEVLPLRAFNAERLIKGLDVVLSILRPRFGEPIPNPCRKKDAEHVDRV